MWEERFVLFEELIALKSRAEILSKLEINIILIHNNIISRYSGLSKPARVGDEYLHVTAAASPNVLVHLQQLLMCLKGIHFFC